MEKKKKPNWTIVKVFEKYHRGSQRWAAVELSYLETRNGLAFSYTPFMMTRDGGNMPVMHLRDDLITDYIVLFQEAAQIAQRIRARWNSEEGRSRLTANIFEHVMGKKNERVEEN